MRKASWWKARSRRPAFYGVNAFKFPNAQGVSRYARYQIIPEAGEHALTSDQTAKADPNYLMDELPQRLAKGPVKFRLQAQWAKDGDPTDELSHRCAAAPIDRHVRSIYKGALGEKSC